MADPFVVASRIAFARRVGWLVSEPRDAQEMIHGGRVRVKNFDLRAHREFDPERYLRDFEVDVDLRQPDFEFTVVRGEGEYVALTSPSGMNQRWSQRRPRRRAFFHPAAMFPKLSRALVNLSRVREGETLLDPFSGTGSIPIEAAMVGVNAVAMDRASKMSQGSAANMRMLKQDWMGVLRADAFSPPLTRVDAVVTDVPYGRASSTNGVSRADILARSVRAFEPLLDSGSRVVLMHAKGGALTYANGLELEEEHDLYVHKLLTRTISVLRKR